MSETFTLVSFRARPSQFELRFRYERVEKMASTKRSEQNKLKIFCRLQLLLQ